MSRRIRTVLRWVLAKKSLEKEIGDIPIEDSYEIWNFLGYFAVTETQLCARNAKTRRNSVKPLYTEIEDIKKRYLIGMDAVARQYVIALTENLASKLYPKPERVNIAQLIRMRQEKDREKKMKKTEQGHLEIGNSQENDLNLNFILAELKTQKEKMKDLNKQVKSLNLKLIRHGHDNTMNNVKEVLKSVQAKVDGGFKEFGGKIEEVEKNLNSIQDYKTMALQCLRNTNVILAKSIAEPREVPPIDERGIVHLSTGYPKSN